MESSIDQLHACVGTIVLQGLPKQGNTSNMIVGRQLFETMHELKNAQASQKELLLDKVVDNLRNAHVMGVIDETFLNKALKLVEGAQVELGADNVSAN